MFYKNLLVFLIIFLSGCGFTPLNIVHDGENISVITEKISIGNIPNYEGYLLKTELQNRLNPEKNNTSKEYFLQIQLRAPSYSEQSIQGDNFASRENVSISANFSLKDLKTNKVILKDSTSARGAYNIVKEPYATNTAKNKLKNDLIQIVANNITIRIVSFLKTFEESDESKTPSN